MLRKVLGVLINLTLLSLVAGGMWNFCDLKEVWVMSVVYTAGFIPAFYLLRRLWVIFDQIPLSHPMEKEMRSFLMITLIILWPPVAVGWFMLIVWVASRRQWGKLGVLITLSFEEVEIREE